MIDLLSKNKKFILNQKTDAETRKVCVEMREDV